MRLGSMLCRLALVLLLGTGFLQGQSLSKSERSKLHPTFQAVLSQQLPQLGLLKSIPDREPAGTSRDGSPLYDVIIRTADADAVRRAGVHVNSVFPGFVTALLTPADLVTLAKLPEVWYLDPGSINYPQLDLSIPEIGANLLHSGFLNNTPYKGRGAIVVIYDTGIDWRHFDFRDPNDTTKTRILSIWDQTISAGTGESPPAGFNYGVEYTKAQIEAEFVASPPNFVRQKDINGHGTHVASTAAGNGFSLTKKYVGVAPEADLIIVKGGDGSFSEVRMSNGLTYANTKATALGKPVVLNWSIGGQTGPHDGTRDYEKAVNDFVSSPGRVVVISAGNDGGNSIHIGGSIASGTSTPITINVPSYTATSGTSNDRFILDIWFEGNPSLRATLTTPSGVTVTRNDGQTGTHGDDTDGTIDLWNYQSSLNNEKNIYLDVRDVNAAKPPKEGMWTLTIQNLSGSVKYDGWLSSRTVGTTTVTVDGANTNKTVSMPATAEGAISVASQVTKWSWPTWVGGPAPAYSGSERTNNISTFSSIGPTRDGRQKPEIAAPGQGITAALSSSVDTTGLYRIVYPGQKHFVSQGTSMAAPHVAGAAALLLGEFPTLTASQIKSLMTSTAIVDAFTGSVPNVIWGFGKLNILAAMAKAVSTSAAYVRTILAYDAQSSNTIFSPVLTGTRKYAVRYSPTTSGRLTGMQLNVTTANNFPLVGPGPLVCEVFTNAAGSVGGIPGTKLGSSVLVPFGQLNTATNNYIDLTPANVTITAGQDFHLVISSANAQDTLKMRADDGSAPTSRTSIFDGSKWLNVQDPASGQSSVTNLRMRAIITSISGLVTVEQLEQVPMHYELHQNFPNPFNPATTIRYSIPKTGYVKLTIFDLMGREIATLVDEEQSAGTYQATWKGTTGAGVPVSSGVYFYKLETGNFRSVEKMVLLK